MKNLNPKQIKKSEYLVKTPEDPESWIIRRDELLKMRAVAEKAILDRIHIVDPRRGEQPERLRRAAAKTEVARTDNERIRAGIDLTRKATDPTLRLRSRRTIARPGYSGGTRQRTCGQSVS